MVRGGANDRTLFPHWKELFHRQLACPVLIFDKVDLIMVLKETTPLPF
tara:strand:- start:3223 stop:3366 length:144 start_codon:yes stop_codon:yes gene_type:complete